MKTLADIIEYMKEKKVNPLTIDAWDECKERYPYFFAMKELYKDRENREVIVGNYKVRITFTPGVNMGMAQEPDEYTATVLLNF